MGSKSFKSLLQPKPRTKGNQLKEFIIIFGNKNRPKSAILCQWRCNPPRSMWTGTLLANDYKYISRLNKPDNIVFKSVLGCLGE